MRSGLLILLASCAVMTAPVVAQDDTGSAEAIELTADEQVEELIDEYSAAEQAFYKKMRAAETEEERNKVIESDAPDAGKYVERFMAIANANKGTDAAFAALNWIVQNASDPASTTAAIDALLADHIENTGLTNLCSSLQRNMSESSAVGLEKILAGSPHAEVKGQACFALANHMSDLASMARKIQDGSASEDYIGWYTEQLGEERMADLAKVDVKAIGERAEKLFERVVAEFGDIETRRGTLGASAERSLFEIRNLQIGMVAPEIEAGDLDGVTFKLSDYRGKVVVLDFWGNW